MATKQSDGRYRAKVTVGHDADGKSIVKYVSGRTKKELEAAKEEAKRTYVGNAILVDREILFGAFASQWFDLFKRPHLSAAGEQMYSTIFNAHLLPAFGGRQMRSITPNEIQAFLNTKASSKSKVDQIYMVLRQIFKAAHSQGIIDRNPTDLLKKPIAPEGKRRALTDEETKAVLHVGATHEHGLLLLLLYYTGARRGEVLGLQWRDIDFDARKIRICRDIDFKAGGKIGDLKTESSEREIPLVNELYLALQPVRGLGEAPVIMAPDGGYLSQKIYRRRYESLMASLYLFDETIEHKDSVFAVETERRRKLNSTRAGKEYKPLPTPQVSVLTAHYFRHNYASLLYNADVDVLSAQKWLGHKDISTTLNIYSHLGSGKEALQVDKLQAVFSSIATS